jgi:hypothetical protein
MDPRPRSRAQRRRDTEHRLTNDIDVWVASASADSPTGRSLATSGSVRLGLGRTRDVAMIEGTVEVLRIDLMRNGRWLA